MSHIVSRVLRGVFKHRARRMFAWMGVDLFIIVMAYTLAYAARSVTSPLDYAQDVGFVLAAGVITVCALYIFTVYHRIWSQTSGHGIVIIIVAVVLATVVVSALDLVLNPRPLPVSVVLMGNVLAMGGLIMIRYRSRLIRGLEWRWRVVWHGEFPAVDRERVLIVGAGESGETLVRRLRHGSRENNYKIVGFVDDAPHKQQMYVEGCPILGYCADIQRLVEEHDIDLIIMAIHKISGADFRRILGDCERTTARIKVMPDSLAQLDDVRGAPPLRDVKPEDLLGRSVITRYEAIDLTPVTGRSVLVTGAAGSIGSELSRQLIGYKPIQLILLDNNESGLHDLVTNLQTEYPDTDLISVLADIAVRDALYGAFATHRPEIVFHAAAYKHVPLLERYPCEAIRVNVIGTRHLTELAREYGVERFVLISTDKAVHPTSLMGASKRVCELLMVVFSEQNSGQTRFTAVRFGNVLGSRGSVVPTFNRQISKGGPVTVTHEDMTRYFMSIAEAANLVIHAACLTQGGDIFVLDMGEVVRIVDIAERMIRLRGLRPHKDIAIEYVGARPGEKLSEQLYADVESPVPTVHPHIIKLNSWQYDFDTALFMDKLDGLIRDEAANPGCAARQLIALANVGYNPPDADQIAH